MFWLESRHELSKLWMLNAKMWLPHFCFTILPLQFWLYGHMCLYPPIKFILATILLVTNMGWNDCLGISVSHSKFLFTPWSHTTWHSDLTNPFNLLFIKLYSQRTAPSMAPAGYFTGTCPLTISKILFHKFICLTLFNFICNLKISLSKLVFQSIQNISTLYLKWLKFCSLLKSSWNVILLGDWVKETLIHSFIQNKLCLIYQPTPMFFFINISQYEYESI